ncbi:MAG: hypothetical protein COA97_05975 [Flavobacteriales bacterium]|nr:MAG: hypothetical protein COA97_05975 [Flavobacteriales bacterium]
MLSKSIKDNNSFKPIFFDIKIESEYNKLSSLLKSNPSIEILDEIKGQLEELLKLKNPKKKFTTDELKQEIKKHLNNTPIKSYGVWVYYPWLNKLIHLLAENEFIEVRTNRNQYKITPDEKEILATKKIGIIGLSVGKAIAITMAMERICGELILADFDIIELSNLNRIQTGVQNFGVKKTIVVAREIAEIDPYLKVTCLHDGLTEQNVNDFFTKDGKLDICIEVCDGLYTKIFARQKAKELGIPVVMNSSDRGTTDIERFDLDPSLPILHGLIDHLDLSLVKEAKTNEEKVPYLLPMLGVETSSERLKASMLEIEETITTWPQLASGVVFGGGICTDVCRRILLNQFTNSGRYFVDTEQHINNNVTDYISANQLKEEQINLIPKTNLEDYADTLKEANEKLFNKNNDASCELTNTEVEELVKYAIMAPSGGNVQPWKWLFKDKILMLFNDINRCESILNYKNTASLISLGAATENLILKAHQMEYEVEINKFPLGIGNDLITTFNFLKNKTKTTEEHLHDNLIDVVPKRLTNRNLSKKVDLKEEDESYFHEVVNSINGAELKIFKDVNQIEKLKEILAEVDKLFMTNKTGHAHFIHEIRWTKKEVEETRDGIDINTIDLTPAERAGLIVAKNWNVTKHIKKWKLGNEFGKLSKKAVDSAAALGMITMPKFDADNFFEGGRAVQKLWLAATEKGIAFQPMSISTFLFAKVGDNNFDDIEEIKDEMTTQYDKLKEITGMAENQKDVFFFRLASAPEPKIKALRRHVEDVLMYE